MSLKEATSRLLFQLEMEESGFWFGLAVGGTESTRSTLRAVAENACRERGITFQRHRPEAHELQQLAFSFSQGSTGLHWICAPAANTGILDWNSGAGSLFAAMNERREALRERVHGGIIVEGQESLKHTLRTKAPDLFSIRACILELGSDQETPFNLDVTRSDFARFATHLQRDYAKRFFTHRLPRIVFVTGEEGMGHSFVTQGILDDLEAMGHFLYKPVAHLSWFRPGESLKLASAFARALNVSDWGTSEELEKRVAQELHERSSSGRTLVIKTLPIPLREQYDTLAMIELIAQLFLSLMSRVAVAFGHAPSVVLILPVVFRRARGEQSTGEHRLAKRGRDTIARIASPGRYESEVRVVALPELQPITTDTVAAFLEDSLDVYPGRARALAKTIVESSNDNPTIIARVEELERDERSR